MSVQSLAFACRAQWERAQSVAMCQALLVSVTLLPHEFAGFCAGYLGEGKFLTEPFHVRFSGDAATHLVIGDRSILTRSDVPFERWPLNARQAVGIARKHLLSQVVNDEEGFLVASREAHKAIRWSTVQPDEGVSESGKFDPRVWLRITAQLGLAGAQTDEE